MRCQAGVIFLALLVLSAPAGASSTQDNLMFNRLIAGLKKPSSLPDLPALQNAAVRSIAADVTNLQDGEWEEREWVYLAVNHEVLVAEGRRSSTQAEVIANKPGAEQEELGFRLSMESKAHLLALRDAMTDVDGKTWTVVDLTVERSGKYDLAFSYDAPPRLNGDLLHSPLTGLLERYRKAQLK